MAGSLCARSMSAVLLLAAFLGGGVLPAPVASADEPAPAPQVRRVRQGTPLAAAPLNATPDGGGPTGPATADDQPAGDVPDGDLRQAPASAYVAFLPAVQGCRTRREHVPAPTRARMEARTFERVNPVYEHTTVPQYRTEQVPVYAWRDVPVYQTRRVPRFEEVTVTTYGWREVPNVIERKEEVWEDVVRPRLVEKMVPTERHVVEEIYEHGEEPIEKTVRVPRVVREVDPATGCEREVTCGCDEVTVQAGMNRFKRLSGHVETVRPQGVQPVWVEEGTMTERVFRGVRTERIVQGTRRERVAVGTRVERRLAGYDEERIPCGTRRERYQSGMREVATRVGTLVRRERVRNEIEVVTYGWKRIEDDCGCAGTRPVSEGVCLPALRVTVVPDGVVGAAPLPGTRDVLTASEFAAEQARRAQFSAGR